MDHEKKTPPAVAEFAVVERAGLLARIEEQAWEIEQLMETFVRVADFLGIDTEAARKAPGKPSDVFIAALKAQQSSGVVLPRRATTLTGNDLDTQLAEAYNDALDEVARLNKSPIEAGDQLALKKPESPESLCVDGGDQISVDGVDERAAFEAWGESIGMTMMQLTAGELEAFKAGAGWQARARLNASRVPELAGHFVQPYLDRPEVIERVDDSCSSDPDVFPLYRFAAPSTAPVDTEARKNDE